MDTPSAISLSIGVLHILIAVLLMSFRGSIYTLEKTGKSPIIKKKPNKRSRANEATTVWYGLWEYHLVIIGLLLIVNEGIVFVESRFAYMGITFLIISCLLAVVLQNALLESENPGPSSDNSNSSLAKVFLIPMIPVLVFDAVLIIVAEVSDDNRERRLGIYWMAAYLTLVALIMLGWCFRKYRKALDGDSQRLTAILITSGTTAIVAATGWLWVELIPAGTDRPRLDNANHYGIIVAFVTAVIALLFVVIEARRLMSNHDLVFSVSGGSRGSNANRTPPQRASTGGHVLREPPYHSDPSGGHFDLYR